jgi:hypothetical protein
LYPARLEFFGLNKKNGVPGKGSRLLGPVSQGRTTFDYWQSQQPNAGFHLLDDQS